MYAFDCSQDENNDMCREFEVMSYPSIRYFPPNLSKGQKTIGKAVNFHEERELTDALALYLSKETHPPKSWPNLSAYKIDDLTTIFSDIPNSKSKKYAILIIEKNIGNGTFGIQTILNFPDVGEISFRRVSANSSIVPSLKLSFNNYAIVAVDKNLKAETLPIEHETAESMQASVEAFLSKHSISFETTSITNAGIHLFKPYRNRIRY
jgi:thiol oxidase